MLAETFNLDADEIAQATGCPLANIKQYWPGIQASCLENGLIDRACVIAILATVATEVAAFEPINEYGSDAYFAAHYEARTDLGNTQPGDGVRFHGRGFIQVTGRANYRGYGEKLGVPLEAEPELALDPAVAARILGRYFKDHQIAKAAELGEWKTVREKVIGGLNGWDRFDSLVNRLQHACSAAGTSLSEGAIGPRVVELKQQLNAWGKTHPLPKPLADTPLFGPATTAAVEAFQKAHGIQATGKVGQKTWEMLEVAAVEKTKH